MFKILMLIGIIFIETVFAATTMTSREFVSPDYLVPKLRRMEITVAYSEELEKLSIQAASEGDEKRMELSSVFEKKYAEMVAMITMENGKPLFPLYSIKTQDEAIAARGHFEDINPKFVELRDSFEKQITNFFEDEWIFSFTFY